MQICPNVEGMLNQILFWATLVYLFRSTISDLWSFFPSSFCFVWKNFWTGQELDVCWFLSVKESCLGFLLRCDLDEQDVVPITV